MNTDALTKEQSTVELLESLRLPETFSEAPLGEKLPLRPTFGKLSRHRFSRVHPSNDFKYKSIVVSSRELDGESYLALSALAPYLKSLATPKTLRLAVDNAGTPRLIAEPIVNSNSKMNSWNESMVHAIRAAEKDWVRVEANMSASQYEIIIAKGDLGEPVWPDRPMEDLVLEVFKDRIIKDMDHPLLRQLEGLV
jgi:hypothetical protein